MKLRKEMLDHLNVIGQRIELSPTPCFPCMQIGMTLDAVKDKNNFAHLQFAWGGFSAVNADPAVCSVLQMMEVSDYSIFGGGQILMHPSFFNVEIGEVFGKEKISQEDAQEISDFLCKLFVKEYCFYQPLMIEYQKQMVLKYEGQDDMLRLMCTFTTPCTKETWDQLLQLANAQLVAAERYEKLLASKTTTVKTTHLH